MGLDSHKGALSMGLHPHGEYGAKKMLLWETGPDACPVEAEKHGRPPPRESAHTGERSLRSRRDYDGAVREQTVWIADGTVLLKAIPARIQTFDEIVVFFCDWMTDALQTARHVIVVMDDSKHVTRAKYEEQSKRDRTQTKKKVVCSEDLQEVPTTDAYTLETLRQLDTLRPMLADHRETRNRAYDAILLAAFEHVCASMRAGNADNVDGMSDGSGCDDGAWSLTIDGVDLAGAERPALQPRAATTLFSHEWVRAALWPEGFRRDGPKECRGSVPLGEGDIKLPDWVARFYAFAYASPHLMHCNYFLIETNDSDGFLVELLAEAGRRQFAVDDAEAGEEDAGPTPPPFTVVLTLLQTNPSKPDKKRKQLGPDLEHRQRCVESSAGSRFCCVHMPLFLDYILDYLGVRDLSVHDQRRAVALYAGAVVLAGCDFVKAPGARTDRLMAAVRSALSRPPAERARLLAAADGMLCSSAGASEAEREAILGARESLRVVMDVMIANLMDDAGARPMTIEAAKAYTDTLLMRAAWVVAYWNGHERRDVESFGFLPPRSTDAGPSEPALGDDGGIVSCP